MPAKGHRKPIKHGTERGYKAHNRRGEDACEACLTAHSAYINGVRHRPYEVAYQRARRRALMHLANRYPSEYAELLTAERAREGLG